ncbi:ABC transporter ATP-binding protein [Erysipelothrix enhydrae]|uniref:ABC transporter ATP-binding protein n=1 Tax=Erysipelothrix enhydrae TaxID=2890314 RepID=UPI002B2485B6|nr:ABC transporter ATP-binding protein [Erysipelothrix sp. 4322-04]WRB87723.1 ABC transporter ATP-binding protein [Erysipelothrix sp. 4322-04]
MDFFKGYKFKTIIAIFFKFIEAVFELFLPLLMVKLIDVGIAGNDLKYIYKISGYMFLFTILGYMSSIVCQYLASQISQQVGGRIRLSLFEKINTLSLGDTNLFSSSMLTTRVTTDVNQIQEMIAKTIRLAVRAPMIMLGSLYALYQLSPMLGKQLMIALPLFLLVVGLFMRFSMVYHLDAQTTLDQVGHKVKEYLSGVRIVRAFSQTDREIENFKNRNNLLEQKQLKVGFVSTLSSPLTSFMMNLVLVVLVYSGALQINEGMMTQGQMVAVINYCTQLVMTLIVFMNLVMIFARGYTSKKRVNEILHLEPTMDVSGETILSEGPIKIEFQNVSFAYPHTNRKILKNINLKINPNETLGIIGLTGSGKSSLVKLLPRLYDVSEGTLKINDKDITSYSVASLRNRIGYVSQSASFLSVTMEDNIQMGQESDAVKALEHAEGKELLEKGLDVKVQERGTNFSGGQRQRLSIARALAKKPSLLIFDDSFSALDYLTDKRLRENLERYYAQSTKIIISQRTSSVMNAESIIVIDNGTIIAQGSHESLLESCDLYQRIYALQEEDTHEEK